MCHVCLSPRVLCNVCVCVCLYTCVQFQSDLLGLPLERPCVHETTAQGAAFAAGLGVGFWPDVAAVGALWRQERTWAPHMAEEQRASNVSSSQETIARRDESIQMLPCLLSA